MNTNTLITTAVPAHFINQANALHAEITGALRSALEKARELGLIIKTIKSEVPPGQWQAWVTDNLTFSERTAYNYLRIANEWGRLEGTGADSMRGALRLLAAKSTPTGTAEAVTPQRAAEAPRAAQVADLLGPLGKREGVKKATVKVSVHVDALEALEALKREDLPSNPAAKRGEIIRRLIENYVAEMKAQADAQPLETKQNLPPARKSGQK